MKRLMVIGAVAAAVVILAGAGMAVAAGGQHVKAAHNGSAVHGKIMSITPNGALVTIVIQNRKGTTTITADANTKVRVDRQSATLAGLTVGERVHARVVNGVASRISVSTKARHRHGHASAPAAQ
jgi:predicted RNA-binding protein with RPS1 domain